MSGRVGDGVEDDDRELVDAYLDQIATEAQLRSLEARIARCPALARELLQLSQLECDIKKIRQSPAYDVPARAPTRSYRAAAIALATLTVATGVAWAGYYVRRKGAQGAVAAHVAPSATSPHAVDAAALAPSKASASVERIWIHDFEREMLHYPRWDRAVTADCPPGRLGRRCLGGIRMSLRQDQLGVTLGDWRRPFLTYALGLRIRFAAWVGQDTAINSFPINVVFWVGSTRAGEAFMVDTAIEGTARWHDVEVDLMQARGARTGQPLRAGDQISAIHITLPWQSDDVFYLDDFELVRLTESE